MLNNSISYTYRKMHLRWTGRCTISNNIQSYFIPFTIHKQSKRRFYTKRLLAEQRIGPHNEDILSTLVASLLGEGSAEKRIHATRFHIHTESPNMEYIHWFHKFFAEKGYCSYEKVIPKTHIGKNGKIYYSYKFRSWSFSSLNWLYDLFYNKKKKRIPKTISEFLTPRALTIWLIHGGKISGNGVKISTESFSYQDIVILQTGLKKNYSLNSTIQRHKDKWIISFSLNQLPILSKIVKNYMIPSIYHKLNITNQHTTMRHL
uniref:Putative site-specific DNA endonuclease n=1 Tax=Chlorokybus atmophyticus TaxID=3144 RepID=A6YE95_CHLAT|nr:putative site-specific DNA endonuclease [Chlorokybus atmophyticus]ABO15137.1 putative site-specific DNA endonuclease [Chlorokybus atmophyticus]